LIALLWALYARSSAGEINRYTALVNKLRREEARLSATLGDIQRRLDAHRVALADEANMMASIGDETADRLVEAAQALQGQMDTINRHAAALETRTTSARSDMNGLLTDMPRAHAEVSRMAELLDTTGDTAMSAANELSAQLAVLAERGRNADDIASRSAQRLAERVASLDDMTRIAAARIEEASDATISAVDAALSRAATALANARADLEAQGEATVSLIEQGHATIAASGEQATEAVAQRVAIIAERIETVSQIFAAQDEASRTQLARLTTEISDLESRLDGLATQSSDSTGRAAVALDKLKQQAERLASALDQGGKSAGGLIEQAETLLTALDASVREIDETLPLAHKRLQETASASRQLARAAMPDITALETASSAALDRLRDAEALVSEQRDLIGKMVENAGAALEQSRSTADTLARELDAIEEQARALTGTAAPQLIDALLRIRDTANQAADHARTALDHVVPEAAAKMGSQAREALEAALSGPVEEQMALIAQRAEQAIAAARQATADLNTEVAQISAAALGLEDQIGAAKDAAVRGDTAQFARRMGRLVEALNNSAINVSRILSTEVTEAAWGAYLRGERGIFTRQAVKLTSATEAREIRRLYADDDGFQTQVNQYIHDFESMLRNVMATRDGDVFSVTLLSSDAGKLYVTLAQSIERLRR
ncbi:MAG: hypothetical protein KGN98_08275, partial [Alphaproteobacteria bacterium]|nr:hypothetical protein [Alphaproteobacteria bacterium]